MRRRESWVTTGDIAKVTELSADYVRGWIATGELPAVPVGSDGHVHHYLVRIDVAATFLTARGFRLPADWIERAARATTAVCVALFAAVF